MKVTLFGATGFVGTVLLRRLLDAGHEVKVLARNPDKLGELAGRVEVIAGNFFRSEDINSAVDGSQVVMSTIGPSTGEMSADFARKCVAATEHLLRSMRERGTRRLIFMAGAAMPLPGERLHGMRTLMRLVIGTVAHASWAGKVREMELALESGLDVTIVRPPMIRESVPGIMHADETRIGGPRVDVGQVAGFMVAQLADTAWIGKAPVVWTGGSPRGSH